MDNVGRRLRIAIFAIAVATLQWFVAPSRVPLPIRGEWQHHPKSAGKYPVLELGEAAATKPIAFEAFPTPERPHPFMAPQGMSTIHGDGAASDLHARGPTGLTGRVTVRSRQGSKFPGGMCATLTFSREGLLSAIRFSMK